MVPRNSITPVPLPNLLVEHSREIVLVGPAKVRLELDLHGVVLPGRLLHHVHLSCTSACGRATVSWTVVHGTFAGRSQDEK